jgi:hypothetical protein
VGRRKGMVCSSVRFSLTSKIRTQSVVKDNV